MASTGRTRSADGMPSGGQESEALMGYLARVKNECKPAIYSAFISSMNAYHGNMLAVDALLDELFVLFSPRVFLLAGIKPLVDKQYHTRIDELCGKVRTSSSSAGSGVADAFPSTANAPPANSNQQQQQQQLGSGTSKGDSNGLNGAMEGRPNTPRGGAGVDRGSSSEAGSPGAVSAVSAIEGSPRSSPLPTLSHSSGLGSAPVAGSPTATNVSSLSTSPLLKPADGPSPANNGTEGRNGTANMAHTVDRSLVLGSPNMRGLPFDGSDLGDLLADIDPTVDPALLDFMMCDNSPTITATEPSLDPTPFNIQAEQQQQHQQQRQQRQQQQQQRQQQQQQQQHWSPSLSSAAAQPNNRFLKAEVGTEQTLPSASSGSNNNNNNNSTTISPDDARRSSAGPPGSAGSTTSEPSPASTSGAGALVPKKPASSWQRSESAGCLTGLSCRIHATPNARCPDCRAGAAAAAAAPVPVRRRCGLTITAPSGASRGLTAVGRRHSLPIVTQSNRGVSSGGNASAAGEGATTDAEEGSYVGSGKRVWDDRAGYAGSGGSNSGGSGNGLSTPPSSFYFPSATAAAAAAAAANGGTPSRPHLKRRISTDPSVNSIEEEHTPVGKVSRGDPPLSAGVNGNGDGGNNGGGGSGGAHFANGNSSQIGTMGGDFAGIGSARPPSMRTEGASNGGGRGGNGGGGAMSRPSNDLEKLVMNVTTRGMQQALQYGLRHTFSMILNKKDREIAELKEEALRWSANDTRLRQLNQQLLNDNIQLRASKGWNSRSAPHSS